MSNVFSDFLKYILEILSGFSSAVSWFFEPLGSVGGYDLPAPIYFISFSFLVVFLWVAIVKFFVS